MKQFLDSFVVVEERDPHDDEEAMNKRKKILRNKMFLGCLTLEDLRSLVRISGSYSVGSMWLPISRTRSKNGRLGIYMENIGRNPDVVVSLDSVVKVDGRMVRIDIGTNEIAGGYMMRQDRVELRIELHEAPFAEASVA